LRVPARILRPSHHAAASASLAEVVYRHRGEQEDQYSDDDRGHHGVTLPVRGLHGALLPLPHLIPVDRVGVVTQEPLGVEVRRDAGKRRIRKGWTYTTSEDVTHGFANRATGSRRGSPRDDDHPTC
jgi:hypothetical protein